MPNFFKINQKNHLENTKQVWKIDFLILLIKNIRSFRKKHYGENQLNVYCDLSKEWREKLDNSLDFDFNHFLNPLKSKIHFDYFPKENNSFYMLNFEPFGILKISKSKVELRKEIEEKLGYFNSEYERAWKLLNNENFFNKAPKKLVEKERKKLSYFAEQKEKLLNQNKS